MKFSESLKKNNDFQNVYRNGKSYANRFLVMYVLKNETEKNRIGISVSKKVGNSVIRHHITRLVRESYRLHEDMFNSGLDIVVIARTTARKASYHEAIKCIDINEIPCAEATFHILILRAVKILATRMIDVNISLINTERFHFCFLACCVLVRS